MFIRYLTEQQILSLGFQPVHEANLCSESFSLRKLNYDHGIHTLISLYDNASSFLYKIVTYDESTIEEGMVTRFSDLKDMVDKYINNDMLTYLERKRGKQFSEIERAYIKSKIEQGSSI